MRIFVTLSFLCLALTSGCAKKVAEVVADPTRESVIEDIKSWPAHIRADAERDNPQFNAWANAQTSGICYVHRIQMQRKWLPVVYGLPAMRDEPSADEAAQFPLADDGCWQAGCVVGEVKEKEVYVCAECTAALATWKKSHTKKPNQVPEPISRLAPGPGSS